MKNIKTVKEIEEKKFEEEGNKQASKKDLELLLKGIKKGLGGRIFIGGRKDKEKIKESIIKFLIMEEVKGMFLDENGKELKEEDLKKEDADKIIEEFESGLKEFEEFIKEMK